MIQCESGVRSMMKVFICALCGLFLSLFLPMPSPAEEPGKENKNKKVEIQAKVHYIGNSYSRLPDGTIIGTQRFYEYEGCYIMVKDRKVNLQFQPAMELV